MSLIRKRGFNVAVKRIHRRRMCRGGPGKWWDTAGTLKWDLGGSAPKRHLWIHS